MTYGATGAPTTPATASWSSHRKARGDEASAAAPGSRPGTSTQPSALSVSASRHRARSTSALLGE